MNSPYAITPRSQRQNASRRVRRFQKPEPRFDIPKEQGRQLKPRTDSPMVKDRRRTRITKKPTEAKPKIVHHYSASEPTHLSDAPMLSHYRPARAMSQRKSSKKPQTSAVHREGRISDGVSRYGACCRQSSNASKEESRRKELHATPSTVSRKRRSCAPAMDGSAYGSAYHPSDMSSKIPAKKRRQSLPERVKDSKFLSRLLSSESRTSKRLHPKLTEKVLQKPEPHQEHRKSSRLMLKAKTARRQSEPPTTNIEVMSTKTPNLREKHRVLFTKISFLQSNCIFCFSLCQI